MGSLFTSIIPNLICEDVVKAIDNSGADVMYICNIMTQPGETDNFTVSDHINAINSYLGNTKVSTVIVNNGEISKNVMNKYLVTEQKDPVIIDEEKLIKQNIKVIKDNLVKIENESIRHNQTKLGLQIYSNLIK